MKRFLIFLTSLLFSSHAFSQNNLDVLIRSAENGAPLADASIIFKTVSISAKTDQSGRLIFGDIPNGQHIISIQAAGYATLTDTLNFPLSNPQRVYELEPEEHHEHEMEEVIISSTRSSRTIAATASRIEVIAGEELDEKSNMKPGDIRMILNESTGIQTQQISAGSANAAIRIQGLDGRYTQLLKDGFPLYSGAAGGLGLLQTPPLDLRQVEVIKGSASTLYGGGAIAGLVNLISKKPGEEQELSLHLNGTSGGGLDLNMFYAEDFGKAGITAFASRNSNKAYDPSGQGITAIPQFERYVFNPKLFLDFSDATSLTFGINSSIEDRVGGATSWFSEGNPYYFEKNATRRISSQLSFRHRLSATSQLNFKNSVSYYNRRLNLPSYGFEGEQLASFSEINITRSTESSDLIAGLNIWSDRFQEVMIDNPELRNYSQNVYGAFLQYNLQAGDAFRFESGLRIDQVPGYGLAVLPRVSGLLKLSDKLSSRIGGGLGYKVPDIFTEESERLHFRGIRPIHPSELELERSYGANWDFNYVTGIFNDQLVFSLNHMFYYTRLEDPLLLEYQPNPHFVNSKGHIRSRGVETNLKLSYADFKLFVGYTLTDARIFEEGNSRRSPLTAKHRLNNVLMYELEHKWKLGLEAYYYSRQDLNDGSTGRPFWIGGFMAERLWERFSIYLNFENFTDTRQTRFENINAGDNVNPLFRDIYAPLDGFVVNGGLKIRL